MQQWIGYPIGIILGLILIKISEKVYIKYCLNEALSDINYSHLEILKRFKEPYGSVMDLPENIEILNDLLKYKLINKNSFKMECGMGDINWIRAKLTWRGDLAYSEAKKRIKRRLKHSLKESKLHSLKQYFPEHF